jgi:serine-type D-Ala-D-Ala carboxypeptidase (penicillin-binding protein 5/6)
MHRTVLNVGGQSRWKLNSAAMRKLLAAAAALVSVSTTVSAATAWADNTQPVGSIPIPDGPAQTWIVADLDSGQVLAGRDQNVAHPPASTIKTLLAQVVLDEVSLDSTVVADVADTQVECNCVGIKPGRTYTARQLLDGLLLVSGNDAANTLAHMLGGPDAAVAKMNAKAAALGAGNTHAATPSGLDGPGGSGWSTAHDLAVIFRAAMANPVFAHITAEPSAMFPGDHGDEPITNQDELLQRYPGAIGGKTGYTNAARKTFVGAAARGGRRLVIAMMYGLVKEGGPTYWDQAATLFNWGFEQSPGSGVGSL